MEIDTITLDNRQHLLELNTGNAYDPAILFLGTSIPKKCVHMFTKEMYQKSHDSTICNHPTETTQMYIDCKTVLRTHNGVLYNNNALQNSGHPGRIGGGGINNWKGG